MRRIVEVSNRRAVPVLASLQIAALVVIGVVDSMAAEQVGEAVGRDMQKLGPDEGARSRGVSPRVGERVKECAIDSTGRDAIELLPERTDVSGRVIDERDRPVAFVTVLLYRGQRSYTCQTDEQGTYVFDDLPDGAYRLFIDGRALPEHLLPPQQQGFVRPIASPPTGLYGTRFQLSGEPVRANLRVFHAASVEGFVADDKGQALAGVRVRIRSTFGLTYESRSGLDGTFLIEGVYPGSYIGKVPPTSGEGRGSHELRFDIGACEARRLPILTATSGASWRYPDGLLERQPF